jgi:hypothetical protein
MSLRSLLLSLPRCAFASRSSSFIRFVMTNNPNQKLVFFQNQVEPFFEIFSSLFNWMPKRFYRVSNQLRKDSENTTKIVVSSEKSNKVSTEVTQLQKIGQAAQEGFSILALFGFLGFAVLGVGYSLWDSMLSPNSSQRLYQKAAALAKEVFRPPSFSSQFNFPAGSGYYPTSRGTDQVIRGGIKAKRAYPRSFDSRSR